MTCCDVFVFADATQALPQEEEAHYLAFTCAQWLHMRMQVPRAR